MTDRLKTVYPLNFVCGGWWRGGIKKDRADSVEVTIGCEIRCGGSAYFTIK